MAKEQDFEKLLTLLNEKEVLLKERELDLDNQQEEFLSQKEELTAAIEEVVAKNNYLSRTLEQLRRRNNELDQLLYRASHDLKTPVSSMFGLIGILRSTATNNEQHAIADHLLQKARQMETVLHSLSELSTAFFRDVKPERCDLENIVLNVWNEIPGRQGAHFDLSIKDICCFTDKTLLTILLSCLLKNAVQFSLPDAVNTIAVNGKVEGSLLTIEISDVGEEISPDNSDRIFEMFYRGSIRSKGVGMGLYIAQRICERLHGEIKFVNGIPRKKFVVTLPELDRFSESVPQVP